MKKETQKQELNEEETEYKQEGTFGYIPSIIFLIFIAFIIYASVSSS